MGLPALVCMVGRGGCGDRVQLEELGLPPQPFPTPVWINLHMETYKKASGGPRVPDLGPDLHLTPPSLLETAAQEVSICTPPVLCERVSAHGKAFSLTFCFFLV